MDPLTDEAAVVFTRKSIERILSEGGTSSWRLDRGHALRCAFAVCTRNSKTNLTEGREAHCSAFLVGKIKGVVSAPDYPGRYLIQFSEFARVSIPSVWKGDRNPVKYGGLKQLGIDPSKLKWERMPQSSNRANPMAETGAPATATPLTMAEAKKGLALTFGVKPEAIEITIRG